MNGSFDPAAWLRRFSAAGGCYVVTNEPRISLSYPLDRPADAGECSAMLKELGESSARKEALRLYLIGSP
jgi:hypothetical protein